MFKSSYHIWKSAVFYLRWITPFKVSIEMLFRKPTWARTSTQPRRTRCNFFDILQMVGFIVFVFQFIKLQVNNAHLMSAQPIDQRKASSPNSRRWNPCAVIATTTTWIHARKSGNVSLSSRLHVMYVVLLCWAAISIFLLFAYTEVLHAAEKGKTK